MSPSTLSSVDGVERNSPLQSSDVEAVQSLIEAAAVVPPPLRSWQILLYCGHEILYEQHASLHAPDMLSMRCPLCHGVQQSLLEVRPADPLRKRTQEEQQVRLELRRATDEVRRSEIRLARARQRIERLQAHLALLTQNELHPLARSSTAGEKVDSFNDVVQ